MRKASREPNEQREHNQTCLNYARGEKDKYHFLFHLQLFASFLR